MTDIEIAGWIAGGWMSVAFLAQLLLPWDAVDRRLRLGGHSLDSGVMSGRWLVLAWPVFVLLGSCVLILWAPYAINTWLYTPKNKDPEKESAPKTPWGWMLAVIALIVAIEVLIVLLIYSS